MLLHVFFYTQRYSLHLPLNSLSETQYVIFFCVQNTGLPIGTRDVETTGYERIRPKYHVGK